MPRRASPDTSIGERIKIRRELRRWSIRHAADRAGISHTTWSRIERGLMAADNRYLVADIAAALECAVADLTGSPMPAVDRDTETAHARVHALRLALVEADLTEPSDITPRSIEELQRDTALVSVLRNRCDFAGVFGLAPRLIRELHASAAGPDWRTSLELLVYVLHAAHCPLKDLGYPAEEWLVGQRLREASEALGNAALMGVAAFDRTQAAFSCGAYSRALALATRAIDNLGHHADAPGSLEMLGLLQLCCAYASMGLKRADDSAAWIADADDVARRTGETNAFDLQFGPTNVNFWRIGIQTDGGDPGKAVEVAARTNPAAVGQLEREVAFYRDTARALARTGKDREAIRYLLIAERMAPQRIRSSATVKETARALLERSRRQAGGTELRGLCERMGIAG